MPSTPMRGPREASETSRAALFAATSCSKNAPHPLSTPTASGNPMRFTTGKVAIRRDDRWRTAMPPSHRRTVTALTLPLLARYGYPRRAA